ncbi:unnamed protein product [Prorocentrum cordatum]|uniref:Uncharacterized protein n=1 Tax=Prorocentrum cordatum TaxID=2364126 RepID=A0ABN9QPC5_9DINO|nr:unnamed protein product [Polarella glacialis]
MRVGQLQRLGAAAMATAKKGKRAEVSDVLLAHTNWLQEQEAAGSGKLHRKTRDKPRCDNEVRDSGVTAANMIEYMDAKGRHWQKKWTSHFSRGAILEKLAITREAAADEGWEAIEIEDLNSAIESMAKSKAKGIEQMGALTFKWLPPSAREEPRKLIEEIERMGAWPRQLMVTLASLLRKVYAVTALWDLAEFYDTLEPVLILKEGLRLGIPARTLHLEMLGHLGARLIREKSAHAEPIAPDGSICAGARGGVDFGRVALCAVLEKVGAKYERVYARSWVGDVATRVEGSRREVVRQLSNAGVDFAAGVKKARLTLSTRSALIGGDMDVAKEVALRLHSRNIAVKVFGVAPGNVTMWRRRLAGVIAPKLRGRCLTALLHVEIAKGGPAFGAAFALLDSWMRVISDGGGRKKAEFIWPGVVKMATGTEPKKCWKGFAGVTRAMVNALVDLDWGPKGPWHWVSDAGEEFGGSDPTGLDGDLDTSDLRQALSDAIDKRQWVSAANHYAGKGLEGGADLRSAKALIRKFKGKGGLGKVGAQLALFAGGVWPRQRVTDLGIEVSPHPSEDGPGSSEWLIAAGDASGGEHTVGPRRQIALAGWRQSVNRGGLAALKELLTAASGYHRIRTHVGLWCEVRELIKGKELDLLKIESHMSAKDAVDAGVDPIDYIGNVLADDFVDGIIERVQVARTQARTLGFAEGIAALVRSRGLATLQAAIEVEPSAGPSQKERRDANVQRKRGGKQLAETKHVITYDVDGTHYGRSRCGGRVPILKAAAWLMEECVPVERTKASTHGAASSRAQVGHQKIHASHLGTYHDELRLHYCQRCGCIAGQTGRQNLSRIEKGLQPGTSKMATEWNNRKLGKSSSNATR